MANGDLLTDKLFDDASSHVPSVQPFLAIGDAMGSKCTLVKHRAGGCFNVPCRETDTRGRGGHRLLLIDGHRVASRVARNREGRRHTDVG